MKFDKYLFLVVFVSFLFSCSEDKIDKEIHTSPIEKYEYNGFLSLAIGKTDVSSKAVGGRSINKLTLVNTPNRIQKLSVAIFSNENNKLMAFSEVDAIDDQDVNVVKDIEVVSGTVKILIIANYDKIPAKWYRSSGEVDSEPFGIGRTTLNNFLNDLEPTTLEKEINGYLTMSSGVLTLNLRAGYNFVGFSPNIGNVTVEGVSGVELLGQDASRSKLKLYHNVARVSIDKLTLDPTEAYGGNINEGAYSRFYLDEIFVANVKSKSNIVSEDEWGIVEYPTPLESASAFWRCGNEVFSDVIGSLKTEKATYNYWLGYDFESYNDIDDRLQLHNKYFFLNDYQYALGDRVDNKKNTILNNPVTHAIDEQSKRNVLFFGNGLPIGVFFYLYENNQLSEDQATNRTLIVMKGDYYYKNPGEKEVKVLGCYYTVPINDPSVSTSITESDHKYVKRNYLYSLELTIKGPGSPTPFDKEIKSNMSASIKVEDWNVVNIKDDVE